MAELINKMQFQVKKSSSDFGTYLFRVLTGGWVGMVMAHIFQMFFGFGNYLFFFIIVLMTGAVLKITKGWGFVSVIVFNLFCILLGVLFRMYIMVAPGA